MSRTLFIAATLLLIFFGCENRQRQIKDDVDILLDKLESFTFKLDDWIKTIEELSNNRDKLINLSQEEKTKIKEEGAYRLTKDEKEFNNILKKLKSYDVLKYSPEQLQRFDELTDKVHLATQKMITVFKRIKAQSQKPVESSDNSSKLTYLDEDNETEQSIELYDLLMMFIPNQETSYCDWSTSTEYDTPITWKSVETEVVDKNDLNYLLGTFERKGKAFITFNNNTMYDSSPLYEKVQKKEVIEWSIEILGPRIGVSSMHITNYSLGDDNCYEDEFIKAYFRKKGAKIKLLRCGNDNFSMAGIRFYEIKVKNKPKMFLTVVYSGGSGGWNGDFIFHFNEPDGRYFRKQELNGSCD